MPPKAYIREINNFNLIINVSTLNTKRVFKQAEYMK